MAKARRTTTRNNVSGALRSLFNFEVRKIETDEYGNETPSGEFRTVFSSYGNMRPLLRGNAAGIEDVVSARITGFQPFFITVRKDSRMDQVTVGAWRVVDARNTKLFYNIITRPVDPDNRGQWLEFIVLEDKPT